MASVTVYLSLGSNMGNRQDYLTTAVRKLNELIGSRVIAVSKLYETKAWGGVIQDDFLNMVVALSTNLSPQELLQQCQQIETSLDRERTVHWGPRTMDIDILTYDEMHIDEALLKIPHPYMLERAFVIIPLADIAPDLVVSGVRIGDIVEKFILEEECILVGEL